MALEKLNYSGNVLLEMEKSMEDGKPDRKNMRHKNYNMVQRNKGQSG